MIKNVSFKDLKRGHTYRREWYPYNKTVYSLQIYLGKDNEGNYEFFDKTSKNITKYLKHEVACLRPDLLTVKVKLVAKKSKKAPKQSTNSCFEQEK